VVHVKLRTWVELFRTASKVELQRS